MRIHYLIFLALLIGTSKKSMSQSCLVDSFLINTGYSHTLGTPLLFGNGDGQWTVTSDPDPGTTEPRPGIAVDLYAGWFTAFTKTQWLSSYSSAVNPINGVYMYEFNFCMNSTINPSIKLTCRADDSAYVYLNNNLIYTALGPQYPFSNPNPLTAIITTPSFFQIGNNNIKVKVVNAFGVASGFNLTGIVKGGAFLNPICCNPNGKIQGSIWNDVNLDGIKDVNELLFSDWQVTLTNKQSGVSYTALTDQLGFYNFTNIPSGDYSIAQTIQTGWIQASPVSEKGVRFVTLDPGAVLVNQDFTNIVKPTGITPLPPTCNNCLGSFRPEPSVTYIVSTWVKENGALPTKTNYTFPAVEVSYPSVPSVLTASFNPAGAIIDGWQRVEGIFTVPLTATDIQFKFVCNNASATCLFDDLRIFPQDGTMKTYVYDPINLRLVAELDERNYATIYEYNEDGALIRVKKETERGVMTIKENKSNSKICNFTLNPNYLTSGDAFTGVGVSCNTGTVNLNWLLVSGTATIVKVGQNLQFSGIASGASADIDVNATDGTNYLGTTKITVQNTGTNYVITGACVQKCTP